ncbi:hypothetical protein HPB48_005465 [Haemaphysalis longicornis]|uniref:Metalloendopeptidase n=1 Tax=Haemaphysalis longicornis TaxID=44386 RepID=A0A9J6H3H4_HAELO|nr:hypothetical protein HPB48_005465 [Haemaphysalis longicornis]
MTKGVWKLVVVALVIAGAACENELDFNIELLYDAVDSALDKPQVNRLILSVFRIAADPKRPTYPADGTRRARQTLPRIIDRILGRRKPLPAFQRLKETPHHRIVTWSTFGRHRDELEEMYIAGGRMYYRLGENTATNCEDSPSLQNYSLASAREEYCETFSPPYRSRKAWSTFRSLLWTATIEGLIPGKPEVTEEKIEKTQMFERMMHEVPKLDDGQRMFQGDMLMSEQDLLDMYDISPSRPLTWPGGIVPYKSAKAVTRNEADLIRRAIAHWMNNTCLMFRELQQGRHHHRLHTLRKRPRLPTVVHEIGHAVGFLHEQSRADRNRFVVVNYGNILDGLRSQFDPDQRKRQYGARYDYTSVMHYSPTAFAASPDMKTITPVNPLLAPLIQRQNGLTFRDRSKANFLYQCDAACTNKPQCRNEGFVDQSCKCVCPPNTEGELCETQRRPYYTRPNCGGRVIRARTIRSPGHPSRQRPDDGVCVWWIQAPPNRKVQLTFRDFELYGRVRTYCIYDRFEIRLQSLYMGQTFCGKEIKPGNVVTSVGRDAIIEYRPYTSFKRGFAVEVKFVPA